MKKTIRPKIDRKRKKNLMAFFSLSLSLCCLLDATAATADDFGFNCRAQLFCSSRSACVCVSSRCGNVGSENCEQIFFISFFRRFCIVAFDVVRMKPALTTNDCSHLNRIFYVHKKLDILFFCARARLFAFVILARKSLVYCFVRLRNKCRFLQNCKTFLCRICVQS